jgi:hypothetical protein
MNAAMDDGTASGPREELRLSQTAQMILDESRMVLPGVQALFGFQLIAVFNQRFQELTRFEQELHLGAIALVAIAVALLMGPAAYHRQAERETASEGFVTLASRLVLLGMVPLMVGIAIDYYLIARLILGDSATGLVLSVALLLVFATVWFVLPHLAFLRRCLPRRAPPA